jgi:hypothetical protein
MVEYGHSVAQGAGSGAIGGGGGGSTVDVGDSVARTVGSWIDTASAATSGVPPVVLLVAGLAVVLIVLMFLKRAF